MYEPFIVATTMSSALKKGAAVPGAAGHVAMATVGVKDDGWWLGLWCVGEREAASKPTLLLG